MILEPKAYGQRDEVETIQQAKEWFLECSDGNGLICKRKDGEWKLCQTFSAAEDFYKFSLTGYQKNG